MSKSSMSSSNTEGTSSSNTGLEGMNMRVGVNQAGNRSVLQSNAKLSPWLETCYYNGLRKHTHMALLFYPYLFSTFIQLRNKVWSDSPVAAIETSVRRGTAEHRKTMRKKLRAEFGYQCQTQITRSIIGCPATKHQSSFSGTRW